jgi:hypothetical protein
LLEHPVKSMVTGVVTDSCAAMSPNKNGNAGLVMAGVQR